MSRTMLHIGRAIARILAGLLLFIFMGCEKILDVQDPKVSPVLVFDEVWKVMDQQYALFAVKGVDWNDSYKQFKSRLKNDMSEKELFLLVSSMLETLKDGHVSLLSPTDTATYEDFFKASPRNFNYENIITNYLKSNYQTTGPAIYKIESSVGYIYYNSFKNDITDAEVDKILSYMNNTKGLIIDVRNNNGGKSYNIDRLFKRFIGEKKLVKYEVTKSGSGHNDFFNPEPYFLAPAGNYYANPVCVLTNRACFSACNDFVLYMSELPNVKLIGDQTGGGGGIPYNYILANGWKIQYTASITLSPEKTTIENGIPPDVNIGITTIDEFNGKDPIIEKAFQLLQ